MPASKKKSNEGIYLVPLEELAAMAQKELAELREEHGDKVPLGFHYVFSNFEGAERFLFNPDDPLGFEKASEDDGNWLSGMWVIVGLAGLMVATVVVVFLPRKKRCKRNRIQGELPTEKNES